MLLAEVCGEHHVLGVGALSQCGFVGRAAGGGLVSRLVVGRVSHLASRKLKLPVADVNQHWRSGQGRWVVADSAIGSDLGQAQLPDTEPVASVGRSGTTETPEHKVTLTGGAQLRHQLAR